jgi:hypothetical protein
MKKISFVLLIVLPFLIIGCSKSRFKINTNESDLTIKIGRLDKDVFALDTNNIAAGIPALKAEYGTFFDLYTQNVLQLGSPDSAQFIPTFRKFLTDPTFRDVYKESQQVYGDVSDIEKKLTIAFKYQQHYFPEKVIPKIYMHISGFNYQVVTTDSILSISIDQYLGADYPPYKELMEGRNYQLIEMTREKVPSDYMLGWLMSEFPFDSYSEILLDNMLYRGKIMYLLETFMPSEKEEVLMSYTPEQLKWCRKNEKQMWTYMAEQKHLFSSDRMVTAKYINTAPTTAFFPAESPGRTGIWLGWQIIRSYMENNKNVGLKELMAEKDYRKILEMSKYKP